TQASGIWTPTFVGVTREWWTAREPAARRPRSDLLAVVVVDRGLGAVHLAEAPVAAFAREDRDLARIRVLAGVDLRPGREREIAHGGLAGVDDLVGDLRPARGAGNHVVLADRIALVAEAQLAFALEDQEHLLVAMVVVERALHLAGRQDREVVAEL